MKKTDVLKFTLNNGKIFGIDISKLRNIVRMKTLNQLPAMNSYVLGVIEDRGCSIPVIDTSLVLTNQRTSKIEDKIILISETSEGTYGFIISTAESILKVNPEMVSKKFNELSKCLLSFTINEDDKNIVSVIDINSILKKCCLKV